MNNLILKFPSQLKEAVDIGERAIIRPHHFQIHNVIMCGMGGSGMGGKYVSDLIAAECKCPFIINHTYTLPAYTDKHSVVIISSYSGNTEETIECLEQAKQSGAKIICITSGGKILQTAKSLDYDFIELPTGWPSPRACLGFSLTAQIFALQYLGLISRNIIDHLKIAADLLLFEQEDIMGKAEKIAQLIHNKIPVIYSSDRTESAALRWRQQINENSKMLSWHHTIPEMNHNELVGWKSKHEDVAVIFLRYKDDLKRNQVRMDLTKQIISQRASTVIEIHAKGQSLAEKLMYITHLGDWVSWFLAQTNHQDASEIEVIDFLKSALAKE